MRQRLTDAALRTLAAALLERHPGLIVVRERVVRRVIKAAHKIRSPGLQVPHATCLATTRDVVVQHVAPDELPVQPAALPPAVCLLAAAPLWGGRPWAEVLGLAWRRAFHARVDQAIDSLHLSAAAVRARVDALGQVAFDEVRAVLRDEERLVPPATDRVAYRELGALLLELSWFEPSHLDATFPGLDDLPAARALVCQDLARAGVGGAAASGVGRAEGPAADAWLWEATRPLGATPGPESSPEGPSPDPPPTPGFGLGTATGAASSGASGPLTWPGHASAPVRSSPRPHGASGASALEPGGGSQIRRLPRDSTLEPPLGLRRAARLGARRDAATPPRPAACLLAQAAPPAPRSSNQAADLGGSGPNKARGEGRARSPAWGADAPSRAQAVDGEATPTDPADGQAEGGGAAPGPRHQDPVLAAVAAAAQGNLARAAMAWARRGREGHPAAAQRARAALRQLVRQLAHALEAPEARLEPVHAALGALLTSGRAAGLSQGARLLADVQRAVEANRRPPWRLDLGGWVTSRGARPWRRPLPGRALARVLHHLRAAQGRAFRAAGGSPLGRQLHDALDLPVELAAARLHDFVRGGVVAVMNPRPGGASASAEPAGDPARCLLRPSGKPSVAWRLARDRVAAELADLAVRRGYTQLADLRDRVATGDAKLPDVFSTPGARLADALLRLDRALADRLGGIHRRGEIYLRGLQRLSSVFFGTPPGRLLTRYVLLPFGGAFVALEGSQHLAHAILSAAGLHASVRLTGPPQLLGVALLIAGLLHVPRFRRVVLAGLRALGRALRWGVVVAPRRAWRSRWVQRLVRSRAVQAAARWGWRLGRAAPLGALGWGLAGSVAGGGGLTAPLVGGLAGVALGRVLVESRLGRDLEEGSWDLLARGWARARDRLLPGLYRAIMEGFEWVVDQLERRLYAVDEALRFRGGDGPVAMAGKLVGGGVWRVVAYVTRLYVNLLVEPQVNPIKHFPVVTVSHKVILPMSVQLTEALAAPLVPALGQVVGTAVAASTVVLLPGVFGFLVWELKANWRLYDANRAPHLAAQVMGSHGETFERLLRPGFHSGTLPKAFRRLRRAGARGRADGRGGRRARARVERVRGDARRFVERALLAVWRELRPLQRTLGRGIGRPRVGEVAVASNRVRVVVEADAWGVDADGAVGEGPAREAAGERGPGPLVLSLEEQSGWLVASVPRLGWVAALDDASRRAVAVGLAGFFARAGVDVTRAQLQAALPEGARYDIDERGLVVWPGPGYEREVRVPLARGAPARPSAAAPPETQRDPIEPAVRRAAQHSWLPAHPVPWGAWARELEAAEPDPSRLVGGYRLAERLGPGGESEEGG